MLLTYAYCYLNKTVIARLTDHVLFLCIAIPSLHTMQ